MSRLVFRVAFELVGDPGELSELLTKRGSSLEEFRAKGVDNLRADLEDALPVDDWEPLGRGPFTITMSEDDGTVGSLP